MKLIKFILDQKLEVSVPLHFVPRIGETVIINNKQHFVDDVVYDLGFNDIKVYLLSQE